VREHRVVVTSRGGEAVLPVQAMQLSFFVHLLRLKVEAKTECCS